MHRGQQLRSPLYAQSVASFIVHTCLPRFTIDGKQIIHPLNYLHRVKIVLIHLDGVDKFSARMGRQQTWIMPFAPMPL